MVRVLKIIFYIVLGCVLIVMWVDPLISGSGSLHIVL